VDVSPLPEAERDRLVDAGAKPLLLRYAQPSDWQHDESGRGEVRPPGRLYSRAMLAFRQGPDRAGAARRAPAPP